MKNLIIYLQMVITSLLVLLWAACDDTSYEKNNRDVTMKKSFTEYNHTAMIVGNVDTSIVFYNKVFQLDTIPFPFPPIEGMRVKWLKVDENTELHLGEFVGDTSKYVNPGHIGFTVASIDTLLESLYEVNGAYKLGKEKRPTIDKMPSGARTITIKDPDGHKIHVIESQQQ